ncbi:MAG: FAD-dependent oxidoreductase [Spirochaetia bacterium]|nr:FAD-dependent oxidoreductase [Spirochaetia bacterium]
MSIIPVYENKKAPCFSQDANGQSGCPALNDIPGFLFALSQRNFAQAFEILKLTNPFSGGCGRFCDHPCEYSCNRGKLDSPVNIRELERFVSDYAFQNNMLPEKVTKSINKSVAIAGAGPAGLSCAYFLKKHGFHVDVFEKENMAGGMMAQGIPIFRYPSEILQWEIDYIKALGVNIFTGRPIGKNEIMDFQKKYDYVIIATGAHKSRKLGIPGEYSKAVIIGVDFLKTLNLNMQFRQSNGDTSLINDMDAGESVAVIGGGYTAIDVARTAARMGKKVTIYYRRNKKDMKIHPGEVEECEKEGILFQYYLNPYEISQKTNPDGTTSLKLEKMTPGEPGSDGKATIMSSGEFIEVQTHYIIKAIGETPDLKFLGNDFSIQNNTIELNGSKKPLYIAGDARFGYARDVGMVVRAVASGRNTATDIIGDYSGIKPTWYTENKIAYFHTIKSRYFKKAARLRTNTLKRSSTKNSFKEMRLPLNEHEAVYGASRCFYCGICVQCDWCYHYSSGAIAKTEKSWSGLRIEKYFKFIADRVNISTRDAVEACPRNAMGFVDIDNFDTSPDVLNQYASSNNSIPTPPIKISRAAKSNTK